MIICNRKKTKNDRFSYATDFLDLRWFKIRRIFLRSIYGLHESSTIQYSSSYLHFFFILNLYILLLIFIFIRFQPAYAYAYKYNATVDVSRVFFHFEHKDTFYLWNSKCLKNKRKKKKYEERERVYDYF